MNEGLRPDIPAHIRGVRLPFSNLVMELRAILGARLVAYLGSVRETRAVHEWAVGQREPSAGTKRRLREAFIVALMLSESDSPETVQAWFEGLNPQLDDQSPAQLLRDGDLADIGADILRAARAFLETA